jgi:hypothetical protein
MAVDSSTDPGTLTVPQRVDLLIADAAKTYRVRLRLNQSSRTPEQAQQFHVCHMFLYNKFKNQRPKHLAADRRTIAWEHLSKPELAGKWLLIKSSDFLLTKHGKAATTTTAGGKVVWVAGQEPDKAASTAAMARFLKDHHVSSMAAPGKSGCGEPCGCGGGASKHVTGEACDLSGMQELARALARGYQGHGDPLDEYLEQFRLWRPMAHLPEKSREEWHVEGMSAVKPRRSHRDHPSKHHHHPHDGKSLIYAAIA